ncbi:MAG TPA: hypothetical protein VH352_04050 [Pseudonocardiaceae bacterium]|jgi:hypothetical protein|nr:hypothetical protein [Pseudonocardiaceae bacterium]
MVNAPCSECGRVNPTSPSDDFCSDVCQQHWHARRTIGYPVVTDIAPPSQLTAVADRWRAA